MFPPLYFSLQVGGILRSAQHSSQFLPTALSPWRESQKVFIYLRPKTKHKTRLPRETHKETVNTLPQISDLGGAENSMHAFVCRDEDFSHSQDAVLSLNMLLLCVRHIKIHFDFYWGKKTREQKISRTKDNCIDLLSMWSGAEKEC